VKDRLALTSSAVRAGHGYAADQPAPVSIAERSFTAVQDDRAKGAVLTNAVRLVHGPRRSSLKHHIFPIELPALSRADLEFDAWVEGVEALFEGE